MTQAAARCFTLNRASFPIVIAGLRSVTHCPNGRIGHQNPSRRPTPCCVDFTTINDPERRCRRGADSFQFDPLRDKHSHETFSRRLSSIGLPRSQDREYAGREIRVSMETLASSLATLKPPGRRAKLGKRLLRLLSGGGRIPEFRLPFLPNRIKCPSF